jgi:S-formylglutathione hydrolase FrmB
MIEVYVRELPLITVMPTCEYGYVDWTDNGPQDERHFIEELIPFIDRVFNTNASRTGRAIGGLSWGGYGALKFALKFPELFCSVVSHSGTVAASRWRDNPNRAKFFEPPHQWFFDKALGLSPAGGKNCLFQLAEQLDTTSAPAIRFDCGTEDFLLEENREFAAHLTELGIPHEFEEYRGGHEFEYWDVHVQEAIEFHKKQLGIP